MTTNSEQINVLDEIIMSRIHDERTTSVLSDILYSIRAKEIIFPETINYIKRLHRALLSHLTSLGNVHKECINEGKTDKAIEFEIAETQKYYKEIADIIKKING